MSMTTPFLWKTIYKDLKFEMTVRVREIAMKVEQDPNAGNSRIAEC